MNDSSIAFVTGASKGVGRGIAIGLARAGWDVAINYYSDEAGAEATATVVQDAGQTAWLVKGDVGSAGQVAKMFAQLEPNAERFRLLVNNAGIQTWASLLDLKEEDWDRVIRTNLKGTFLCTQSAARLMLVHGGGSIINIGSGANKRPFPNLIDYGASKGGIERLTQVAAVELGPHGIRVNCVAPGAIEIERTKDESDDYAGTWAPITPVRRIGMPADVAEAVVFLAGNQASFITGQTIYVDGGLFTQAAWPYQSDK